MFIKNNFIYLLCGGFVAGVFINKFTVYSAKEIIYIFMVVTIIVVIISTNPLRLKKYYSLENKIKYEKIALIITILAFVLLGFERHRIENNESVFGDFYGDRVQIIGEIDSEPSLGSFSNRYRLSINELHVDSDFSRKIETDENIIISTSKYPIYQTGDILSVNGKIEKPENFLNENGIEFNYVNFLAKDDVHGIISYSGIKLIDQKKFLPKRILFQIKTFFLKKLSTVLESPHAELMGGLLLGVKQSLGDELEKEFRIAGLIHVVVLSGYNITIIIVATFGFLSFLPLRAKYILGTLFVLSFAIMVGAGATVMRASIMAFLVILGKYSNRNYNINKSLFFAGLVMITNNPLIIFFDPSFQLSFVASLGLVNFSEKISKILVFVPTRFEMREIVAATTATQIAVLPMILGMTGELSIIALPANLIVLPLIPVTMLLGFVTGIVTILFWPAGLIIGVLPNALLSFELLVVKFFANLPFAMITVKPPGLFQTLLFYCLIIILFYGRPVQVFKKVINVLTFSTRLVVSNKSVLPHV